MLEAGAQLGEDNESDLFENKIVDSSQKNVVPDSICFPTFVC